MHNKRIFCFGCSYTDFCWPTWADIMIHSLIGGTGTTPSENSTHTQGYNLGLSGGSNLSIARTILQAHARYVFTEADTVIVQWTSAFRKQAYSHTAGVNDLLIPAESEWYSPDDCAMDNIMAHQLYENLVARIGCDTYNFAFHTVLPEDPVTIPQDIAHYDTQSETMDRVWAYEDKLEHSWSNILAASGYDFDADQFAQLVHHIDAHPTPTAHLCVAHAVADVFGHCISHHTVAYIEHVKDILLHTAQRIRFASTDVSGDDKWQLLIQPVYKGYVLPISTQRWSVFRPNVTDPHRLDDFFNAYTQLTHNETHTNTSEENG